MDKQLINSLITLKQVLENPAVGKLADEDLKSQLQMSQHVLAHLLVQQTIQPELQSEALQSFGNAAARIEKLFAAQGISAGAVSKLKTLCFAMNPGDFKQGLLFARDVQQQLAAIATAEARALRREIVEIETRYNRQLADAFQAQITSGVIDDAKTTGAINTKTLDEVTFNKFLAAEFPDEKDIRLAGYSFLSAGYSKYTAKIKLAGVKTLPGSVILRGDSKGTYGGVSVNDEYRLLKVLYEHGVCVPRPLAVEETGNVFGAPIMLAEEMPGKIIGGMFIMPQPNAAVCRDIAVKLAKLHQVPIEALGDKVDGAGKSNRDKAAIWLDESYASWKTLNWSSPVYETAFDWLRKNIALYDGARSLVHGDYQMANLLIDGDQVSAILDWEFAHIGNPVYDLGYFYFMAESLASWEEFMRAYREAGGFTPTNAQLDYCILFAATRLGVMVCQTEAGFESGTMKGIRPAVVCGNWNDISITRIAGVLDRVL